LLKKAISKPVFSEQTILALPKQADTPLALTQDRQLLVDSPLLLEKVLGLVRSEWNQVATVLELKRKVAAPLRALLQESIMRRFASRSWPSNIGCLAQKKKPLLFLLGDVMALPARAGSAVDFARAFDEAFHQFDRSRGGHNFVSLVEMRRAVPVDRGTFDSQLQSLRVSGRYTLSGAEGRHGLSSQEREAGIYEDGSLLLFVSRKSS